LFFKSGNDHKLFLQNQKLIRKGSFLQTSGYYVSVLTSGAAFGFCSLTHPLFSKAFRDKESQYNKYIAWLIRKN
jgi:hypothetical protein